MVKVKVGSRFSWYIYILDPGVCHSSDIRFDENDFSYNFLSQSGRPSPIWYFPVVPLGYLAKVAKRND